MSRTKLFPFFSRSIMQYLLTSFIRQSQYTYPHRISVSPMKLTQRKVVIQKSDFNWYKISQKFFNSKHWRYTISNICNSHQNYCKICHYCRRLLAKQEYELNGKTNKVLGEIFTSLTILQFLHSISHSLDRLKKKQREKQWYYMFLFLLEHLDRKNYHISVKI